MKISVGRDRLMHLCVIKMVLGLLKRRRNRSHEDVNQRELSEDKMRLRAFVWTLMNLRVPFEHGIS
jgi:hypothetical protein